ncbi:MAG: hypothetical protein FWH49_03620 [Clostridiales bacterium]|nr:hypothetical protein [Clostridiales bacterium]
MTLTTAVNIFVRQAIQEQAIPFKISLANETLAALKAKEALKSLQEQAAVNGVNNMSMNEIDAVIDKARQSRQMNRGQ